MTAQQIVFYLFSTLAVLSGCCVVASKNPVKAVLFLVFTFFCMAVNWMLLESEFLAIALIVVYVGAVMVLFLFVVMMLDIEAPKLSTPFVKHWPIGVGVAAGFLGLLFFGVGQRYFGFSQYQAPPPKPADYSHVKAIGSLLYSDFLLPFEIAGVILLVAMVAAIGLTFRGPQNSKAQKAAQQQKATKENRLRIVKL